MMVTTLSNRLMSKRVHGSKCLATLICVLVLQEQLQIMLLLANTDLGSFPRKNLNVLVVDILLNQDIIFFMNMADSMVTGIREGTL